MPLKLFFFTESSQAIKESIPRRLDHSCRITSSYNLDYAEDKASFVPVFRTNPFQERVSLVSYVHNIAKKNWSCEWIRAGLRSNPQVQARGPRTTYGKRDARQQWAQDKWMIEGRRNLVPGVSQMKTVLLC